MKKFKLYLIVFIIFLVTLCLIQEASYASNILYEETLAIEDEENISEGFTRTINLKMRTVSATSGDYTYQIEEKNTSETTTKEVAVITGYTGTETTITIPSTLGGKSVDEIGTGAFYQNTTLKKVTIPDSVTRISSGAFADCTNLETIVLGNKINFIDTYAFQNTKISTITIPAATSIIRQTAFFHCEKLTNVIINSNNEYFSSENGVVFNKDKTKLYIYLYAKKDTTYTVPSTVKTIDYEAIMNNYLQSITIPASVTEIKTASWCFMTPALKNVYVNSNNTEYTSVNGVLFSKDKTALYFYPSGKTETTYTIPTGTKIIKTSAFFNSTNLKEINIPSTVTEIEYRAFYGAEALEEITIPSSVEEFGASLFEDCPSLKKATINANSELLSYLTFNKCESLEEVIVNGNIKTIIKGAFYYCPKLTKVTLPDSLERINLGAFWCCTGLENITIPKNVVLLEECAFYDYRTSDYWANTKFDISKTNLKKQSDGNYMAIYDYTVKGTRDYTKAYEVLDIVNQERKSAGLNELQMDKDLLENAMKRATEIVTYFEHERPNGLDFYTAITKEEYYRSAENIAEYQTTSSSVMNSWMNSYVHKTNILNANYTCIGIGCYKADDGKYYWVQLFTNGTATTLSKPQNKTTQETVKILYNRVPFKDVKSTDWYFDAVKYSVINKMIVGTNSSTFSPNQNLTRGMLVTILWRMEGAPTTTSGTNFSDVSSSEYYYQAVKWASSKKIVSGYTGTTKFGPKDNITREQLAVMLNNYCRYKNKYKKSSTSLDTYQDASKISGYAKEAMQWAVGNKVVTGDQNKLTPQGYATRAQAASMLLKYCTYIK